MVRYSKSLLRLCESVTAKRPRTVIDHILKHGHITTQELRDIYGYNHPPRAARDVKEHGIPLERFSVVGSDGRRIAAYRFSTGGAVRLRRFSGRTALGKRIKAELIRLYGARCFIYSEPMSEQELQIDHRIPYAIAGESRQMKPEEFMLLCGSANRAKSWCCEHCENWRRLKRKDICALCYWAYPEHYDHVAMNARRRLDLMWQGDEVS